eukprot:s19_g20.t1
MLKILQFIACAWLGDGAGLVIEGDDIVGPGYCGLGAALRLQNDLMSTLNAAITGFEIWDAYDIDQPGAATMSSGSDQKFGNVTIVQEWKLSCAPQALNPNMQCARSFDSFTNACSVLVQLKTPDGKVHSWPMGFYGYRNLDSNNKTETVLSTKLVLNETTTCTGTNYLLMEGSIFGIILGPGGSDHGPPEHPPVPPVLDGYPPLPTVRANGAPGDPPVVPRVTPTEAPEEKDPWWLWPVIILVVALKISLWTWICRRRCRRIRAYATGPQQDGIPLT